jgi:hypothetical protein
MRQEQIATLCTVACSPRLLMQQVIRVLLHVPPHSMVQGYAQAVTMVLTATVADRIVVHTRVWCPHVNCRTVDRTHDKDRDRGGASCTRATVQDCACSCCGRTSRYTVKCVIKTDSSIFHNATSSKAVAQRPSPVLAGTVRVDTYSSCGVAVRFNGLVASNSVYRPVIGLTGRMMR